MPAAMTDPRIENEGRGPTARDGVEGPPEIQEQVVGEYSKKYTGYPPTVGRIFWTGKPKSSVRGIDKKRLNCIDGPNNNRKRRPWIVVEELPDGKVRVMSSTTQGCRGWDAVSQEYQQFFLPISPTDPNGRPVLKMEVDFGKRFVGKSLLYLCIEVDILASVLQREQCMGYLEPSAVGIILRERTRIREAERAVRGEQVTERGRCGNDNWRQRNLAGSEGYSYRRPIRGGPSGPNSQGHPSLPPRPEFSNGSNARSTGRRDGARSGHPAHGLGAPAISPHGLRQIGAYVNQDPDENHTGNRSRGTYGNSCVQNRPRPGHENPPPQNTGRLQADWGRSSGSTPTSVAAPVPRLSAQENPSQDPRHYQTEGRVNKNGSQKRRERQAREKLSRY